MSDPKILSVIAGLRQASQPGKTEDGTRVHIHYKAFGTPTPEAVKAAQRSEELGLPRDRYTGRVSRIWKSGSGDLIVTVKVELERDHMYRSFNVDKGEVVNIVVLGD